MQSWPGRVTGKATSRPLGRLSETGSLAVGKANEFVPDGIVVKKTLNQLDCRRLGYGDWNMLPAAEGPFADGILPHGFSLPGFCHFLLQAPPAAGEKCRIPDFEIQAATGGSLSPTAR